MQAARSLQYKSCESHDGDEVVAAVASVALLASLVGVDKYRSVRPSDAGSQYVFDDCTDDCTDCTVQNGMNERRTC